MAGPVRNRIQRESDLQRIAEMYLSGRTQSDIGNTLGLTQQTISNDLKALQKRWVESSLRDFDDLRAEQLAKIDKIEAHYWAAWDRSRTERKRNKVGRKTGDTNTDSVETATEGRDGNPAFLMGVERCIDRRCKLLGLDAPTKIAPTTPDGTQPYTLTPMTPDEAVATYMDAIQRATAAQ